ncbi:hypothetical protein [Candidatus Palauibacter sp.]|uniref:hypothetical protein n=1 Tax=Candidatus Palauibacter sp. TaxID=3101350 RepID=UPI003B520B2B
MTAKEAITAAREHVQDLFRDEGIARVGLEELDFRDAPRAWDVTIGFTRRLPNPDSPMSSIAAALGASGERVYKIVRISEDGEIMSLKHRHFAVSD